MKKINISKIIWITGIFIFLIIILFLVIEYKVKYEDLYKIKESSNFILNKSTKSGH